MTEELVTLCEGLLVPPSSSSALFCGPTLYILAVFTAAAHAVTLLSRCLPPALRGAHARQSAQRTPQVLPRQSTTVPVR